MLAIAALCGLLAFALVLAATRLGAGATPDTGHYLATADSVLQGRGFVRLGPEIMTSWPPLYPLLLAGFGAAGIDMLTGARLFNALMLAVCAAASVGWVGGRTQSLAWGGAAGGFVALSPPLVYSASLALTDAPFAAVQVLALWRLDAWVQRPRRATLAVCVVCIALACLLRYNGVVLIATAVIAALMLTGMDLAGRLRHAVLIGFASGAPLALWFVRNVWLTGTPAGPRVASEYPLLRACADAGYTVMSWFVPYRVMTTSRWTGVLLLVTFLAAVAALAWRGGRTAIWRTAAICLMFVSLFLAWTIFMFTRVSIDPLADRMLAPAYAPLVVAALTAAAVTVEGFASRRRLAVGVAAVGVLLVIAVSGSRAAGIVERSWNEGSGGAAHSNFNTPAWRSSPTLQWAGQHLRDELVFASSPAALYISTGATSRPMPRKHARRSPGVPHDDLARLRAEVAQRGEAYLVVVARHVPTHTFSLHELASAFVVTPVQTFADGTVYRLLARTGPSR